MDIGPNMMKLANRLQYHTVYEMDWNKVGTALIIFRHTTVGLLSRPRMSKMLPKGLQKVAKVGIN